MSNNNKNFNPLKIQAIELFAIGGLQQREIAKEIGVSETTISSWKKDPNFIDDIIKRSRELLKQSLPHVYNRLSFVANQGDVKAIKLVIEHLERLEELRTKAAENQITFTWKSKE
jgi:DNA-binding XRE family transcriptional regulator